MVDLSALSAYPESPVALPITGGCACGAVRYSVTAQPVIGLQCHCHRCQKLSAAGHGCFVVLPADAASVEGEVSRWSYIADSGGTSFRYFCPTCGAMAYAGLSRHPEGFIVAATSLDDPEIFRPSVAVFAKAARSWDPPAPYLTTFAEGMG